MQEALLRQYIESLKQRLGRIDSLRAKLAEGNPKADENIRLLAHSLHGSGATFGFPEISEAAKTVEHADPADMPAALGTLHQAMAKAVAANPVSAPRKQQPGKAKPAPDQAAPSPRQPTAAPKPAARANKPIKILVVDDDPEITALIGSSLEKLAVKPEIMYAMNGAKAQEAVVKSHFDLIIMDLVLPDKDGRELIQQIKVEFQIKTPLLVLSAVMNDGVRVECMSLGADKFLTKPFHSDELLSQVKNLLGQDSGQTLTLVPKDNEFVAQDSGKEAIRLLAGKTILVADDDKLQSEIIRQRLIHEGAQVRVAENGREAMQLLRSQQFSLVILDVKMPVMDGFEVLGRIKGEMSLEIPVIMVTAMGSEEDIIRGYELGATDYILKPFSEVLLVARVKTLLKPQVK